MITLVIRRTEIQHNNCSEKTIWSKIIVRIMKFFNVDKKFGWLKLQ